MNEFVKIFGLAIFWCLCWAFTGTVVWSIMFIGLFSFSLWRLTKQYPELIKRVLDKLLSR